MDLVPLVQLLEGPEGTNLSAAICGMEEEGADPENLHYRGQTPSSVSLTQQRSVVTLNSIIRTYRARLGLENIVSKRNVIVVGLGYVGCVSSACFAEIGHSVLGVDRDMHKVEAIRKAQSPFFEAGLTAWHRVSPAKSYEQSTHPS